MPANYLADALSSLARRVQHVVIGDSDHTSSQIPKVVADPAVLAGLAEAGTKHLFLEIPAGRANLLDMLTEGAISPSGFGKVMAEDPLSMRDERGWQAMGELAQRAAQQYGMKVHAADERADRLQEFIDKTRAGLGTSRLDFETVAAYMKRIEPAPMPDGSIEGPLTNDHPLADFIKRKAGQEKSATLFGESHGGRKYDLDEMLGNAARCQLFTSERAYAETVRDYQRNSLGFETDPDSPEIRYFIDSGKLEISSTVPPPPSSERSAASRPPKPAAPASTPD